MDNEELKKSLSDCGLVLFSSDGYAVGFRYDDSDSTHHAPYCAAKYAGADAYKIYAYAHNMNVYSFQNDFLAKMSYGMRVGQEIAAEYYEIFANLLAMAYRLSLSTDSRGVFLPPEIPEYSDIRELCHLETLSIEIGQNLAPLVDAEQGGTFLDRLLNIRRRCAIEWGFVLPTCRIRDTGRIRPNDYVIKIRGAELCRFIIRLDRMLAIDWGNVSEQIDGEKVNDPCFNLPGVWINRNERERALGLGFKVYEPTTVMATHFEHVIRQHMGRFITHVETFRILKIVRRTHPELVESVINKFGLDGIRRIFKDLLKEQVPITDTVTILETLSECGAHLSHLSRLIDVRSALAGMICGRLCSAEHEIEIIGMSEALEDYLFDKVISNDVSAEFKVLTNPTYQSEIIRQIVDVVRQKKLGRPVFLVKKPFVRSALHALLTPCIGNQIPVFLSFNELGHGFLFRAIYIWDLPEPLKAAVEGTKNAASGLGS